MKIGLDYRPALVNREGIGRATRELVRTLASLETRLLQCPRLELHLFGWSLSPACFNRSELGIQNAVALHLHRRRFPAKLTHGWLTLSGGVDIQMGIPSGIFHHTQPARLPVKSARQTTMIWDLIFLDEDGRPGGPWVEAETAKAMAESARQAAAESDLILCPTDFVRDDVIAKLGVEPERVVTVGLGCDHLAPSPRATPKTPFVLTVCRVDPRKNHGTMLAAFERLVQAGLPHRWFVVGPNGWRSEEFERALEDSRARARITRVNNASEAQLRSLLSAADAFLFASHAEGFGLPPLEAMAAGTPVVAARATCLPEVLGQGAMLVDPHDSEALFEALRQIIEDPDQRAGLVARGRKQAELHTWRASAEAHLEAWRSLG